MVEMIFGINQPHCHKDSLDTRFMTDLVEFYDIICYSYSIGGWVGVSPPPMVRGEVLPETMLA